MHAVFADPKTDFVFKRIFGHPPSGASREASEAEALNTAESRKSLLIALLDQWFQRGLTAKTADQVFVSVP